MRRHEHDAWTAPFPNLLEVLRIGTVVELQAVIDSKEYER